MRRIEFGEKTVKLTYDEGLFIKSYRLVSDGDSVPIDRITNQLVGRYRWPQGRAACWVEMQITRLSNRGLVVTAFDRDGVGFVATSHEPRFTGYRRMSTPQKP